MIDRKKFFDAIRFNPFPGRLTKEQVQGVNAILDEWDRRGWVDLRWLAYILATAKHETAHTMQPVREYGSMRYLKSKRYWPWIGRGYVQLTHDYNYRNYREEVKKLFGVDIVENPDDALRPDVAAYILFDGLREGRFNRHKNRGLEYYFNDTKTDWTNARQMVNVMDKAEQIAGIAKHFYADLVEATK